MSDFTESPRAGETSQHSADAEALRTLSLGERTRFIRYVRKVLPLDGYVFWLSEDMREFEGALFRDTILTQNEDETSANSTMTFTAIRRIQEFEQQSPNELWVGEFDGIKFSFSRLSQFFEQAGIYYYTGVALQASISTQLIDDETVINDKMLIVSNSLPAWLSLVMYDPIWMQTSNPKITLYPSFLVPQNLKPPYGSVHIPPEMTRALQGAPYIQRKNASHYLLAADTVRITLYGVDNDMVMDFIDLVNQFSIDTDVIGLMNMPLPVDEKRTQVEMGVIAMKKSITYEVSYNQFSMRDLARKVISHARINVKSISPVTSGDGLLGADGSQLLGVDGSLLTFSGSELLGVDGSQLLGADNALLVF